MKKEEMKEFNIERITYCYLLNSNAINYLNINTFYEVC